MKEKTNVVNKTTYTFQIGVNGHEKIVPFIDIVLNGIIMSSLGHYELG